jgi:hypothetical protein
MPKYLVEHTLEEKGIADATKSVKASLSTDAYWIRSYVVSELGKVYCEWDAKDAESIKQVFTKTGTPYDKIMEARIIFSEDYRE